MEREDYKQRRQGKEKHKSSNAMMTQESIRAHNMARQSPDKRNEDGRTRTLYQNELYSSSMISLNPSTSTDNETYTKITLKRFPEYTTFNIQHSLNSCKIAVPEKELEGNEVHIVSDYPFLALYVGDIEFYPFDASGISISEEKLPLMKSAEQSTRNSLTQTQTIQELISQGNKGSRKNSNISVAAQTSELSPGPSRTNSKQRKKSAERALRIKPDKGNYYSLEPNTSTPYFQFGINEMEYEPVDKHNLVPNTDDFSLGGKLSPVQKVHVPTSKIDLEKNKHECTFGTIVEANPSREICIEKWNSHTNVITSKKKGSNRKPLANDELPSQYSHSPRSMFDQLNLSLKSFENTDFFPNRYRHLSFQCDNQKPPDSHLEYIRGSTHMIKSSSPHYDVNNSSTHQEFPIYSDESNRVYYHSPHDEVLQHKHHRPSHDDRKTNGQAINQNSGSISPRGRYVNKDNVRSSLRGKVVFQDQETQSEIKLQRSENELQGRYNYFEPPDAHPTKTTSPRLSPMADIKMQTSLNDMSTQTDGQSEKSVEKKKVVRTPVSTVETSTSTSSGTNINRTQHLTQPEAPKSDIEPTLKGLQHMNSVLLRIQNELRPIQTDMKQLQSKLLQRSKQTDLNTGQNVSAKSSQDIVHDPLKGRVNRYDLQELSDSLLKAKTKFPSGAELLEELSKQIIARTHDTRGKIIHSERNLKEPHASKNPHNHPT